MPDLYVQVVLPLPLHDSYTYRVPEQWKGQVKIGQRVVVQFGSRKLYAALIVSISRNQPPDLEIKEVLEVLDEQPVVFSKNLELWKWMAGYYCCSLGDVFRAALPPGLKLESKSRLTLEQGWDEQALSDQEQIMVNLVQNEVNSPGDLQKKLGKSFSYKGLKSLLERGVILMEETAASKYRPKTEPVVNLHPRIDNEDSLHDTLDSLNRAKKQQALLMQYCRLANVFQPEQKSYIRQNSLLDNKEFSPAVLKELVTKKILVVSQLEVSRLPVQQNFQSDINLLNQYQARALEEVKAAFENKQVTLLHGITASGKTELYIHLIEETLRKGLQALYLLPEIALTTQIVERLKNVFGQKVGIYHSRLNDNERVEIWNKVLQFGVNPQEGYQVILGARSALFMPFSKLGLVVVDEEHEHTFKQFDPAPRYHARDMAVVMGQLFKANVLLGSATPSYESFFNTLNGKYALVNLQKRHSEMELPEIIVADVKRAYKRKQMRSVLSPELYTLMEEALRNREQVVLFQNRRGYSPFVQCYACGQVPKCRNCDVSLTYHKYKKRLNCHYCGYSIAMPEECPECGSPDIKTRGFGTEKVEEELRELFPGAQIQRMDLDTTRSKNAFERIVRDVENRKTDILIGTQMVTKGLDFEHVRVAGILNADNLINFPDFRAHERTYQLISQVGGRAGRKHSRGKVVLQTSQPEHPLIHLIVRQDYLTAFKMQMQERKIFSYPPYNRMIKVVVKHKKPETVGIVAEKLARLLGANKSFLVLGPEFPLVSRVQLWYQKEMWLKINRGQQPGNVKVYVNQCIGRIQAEHTGAMIYADVDPY